MTRPVRLQLKRRAGFDLQALSLATNGLPAVNVTRPGKWGNPWKIGRYRCTGSGLDYRQERVDHAGIAVRFFRETLRASPRNYPADAEIVAELAGKNLACWCKPGAPCHADVLLELANRETTT